jgi:hypothetical protein
MSRAALSLLCLVLLTLDARPAPAPTFEVAAIKLTPPELRHGPSGGNAGKGKYAKQ